MDKEMCPSPRLLLIRAGCHAKSVNPRPWVAGALGWVLLVLFLAWPALTAVPGVPGDTRTAPAEDGQAVLTTGTVEQRLQALSERREKARALKSAPGIPPEMSAAYAAGLSELEAVYQRQLNALKRRESLLKESAFLKETQAKAPGLPQSPPYSLSFFDRMLQQLETASSQEEGAQLELRQARLTLEDARSRSDAAAQALRVKREQAGPSPREKLALEQAALDYELARATLELQQLALSNSEHRLSLSRMKVQFARDLVDRVRQGLHYDEQDLEAHLKELSARKAALEQRIRDLTGEQQVVENAWLKAQRLSEAAPGDDRLRSERAEAFLKEREAWRETYQRVLDQTENTLNLITAEEAVWRQRYALLKGDFSYTELGSWQEASRARLEELGRTIQVQQAYYSGVLSQISALQKTSAQGDMDAQVRQHRENRLQALQKAAERTAEYLTALHGMRLMDERFLDQSAALRAEVGLVTRVAAFGGRLRDLWQLELWVVDERSVTVKKLVVAILILLIGIMLAKRLVGVVNRRILLRTRLDESARSSLGKVIYYFILLMIVLFALKTVNIPLTAFTFLGGALAIGAGFGAQNLINNFISGFILMLERPIKIGDMVEMDGKFGVINSIGARCTSMRTFDNVDILIPNSSFLEKSIINWTMTDQIIRSKIVVGVAYGSPTREVERRMLQAAESHPEVLREPRPFVLFKDFGDNALVFELYVWIPFSGMLTIPSDIRFRIDELFRAQDIVIAFPQRDVHLDTQQPLELRILNDEELQ